MPPTDVATTNDGFWSYVHKDDEASFGKVVDLGSDLARTYEMVTGESISLFVDRKSLRWGDAWEAVIEDNLGSVAFFIPVITPRYFQSTACRYELEEFAKRTDRPGFKGLLLPILWVAIEDLPDDDGNDPLVEIVKSRQWVDWTSLRHRKRGSPAYSRMIEQMARRIKRANDDAAEADSQAITRSTLGSASVDFSDTENTDGTIEKLATMEETIPLWLKDIESIAEALKDMGVIAQEGTGSLTSGPASSSFAGRLTVIRQIASRLQDPASRVERSGANFAKNVSAVDDGIRELLSLAPAEMATNNTAREQVKTFFDQLRSMDLAATTMSDQLGGFVTSMEPLRKQSRDMRKPIQAATNGVTRVQAAVEIIHSWIDIIDGFDLDGTTE